jgi:hypothetical protein
MAVAYSNRARVTVLGSQYCVVRERLRKTICYVRIEPQAVELLRDGRGADEARHRPLSRAKTAHVTTACRLAKDGVTRHLSVGIMLSMLLKLTEPIRRRER